MCPSLAPILILSRGPVVQCADDDGLCLVVIGNNTDIGAVHNLPVIGICAFSHIDSIEGTSYWSIVICPSVLLYAR